jgi:hypothetical protein
MMLRELHSSNFTSSWNQHLGANNMLLPLLIGSSLFCEAIAHTLPDQAQVVDQKALNVLDTVLPVAVENLTTVTRQTPS